MKIVVDENIPFAGELLAQHGEVVAVDGRHIQAAQLADADALLIRSITTVNQELLAQADKLKFVGTATIGTEHVDQALLEQRGISFANAPGCNAIAVGEYVITALLALAEQQSFELRGLTIAIVGAGNTGSQVKRCAEALGMNVLCYDPPLQAQGKLPDSVEFEQVLAAEVISLHVPMNKGGEHPTYHLFDREVLAQLRPEQVLINACRGAVVDNQALLELCRKKLAPQLIWDVWEHEPSVLVPLVEHTTIASPHIAGYSLDGKMRGTSMIYAAMCHALNLDYADRSAELLPASEHEPRELSEIASQTVLAELTQQVYPVWEDDQRFRQQGLDAQGFDGLRKNYPQRREFNSLSLRSTVSQPALKDLGFKLIGQ